MLMTCRWVTNIDRERVLHSGLVVLWLVRSTKTYRIDDTYTQLNLLKLKCKNAKMITKHMRETSGIFTVSLIHLFNLIIKFF